MPLPFPNMDRVVRCIADAETGHLPEAERDSAVGDGGKALGRHQLWEIFVDEVNRILREAAIRYHRRRPIPFSYADRADPARSADMTAIHARYWGERLAPKFREPEAVFARNLQRLHNGGPKGHLKPETEKIATRFDLFWKASEP